MSEKGRPRNAGVVYDFVDGALWIHTMQASRKGRNLAGTPHVGVTIPFRKLPVGPPYTIHFQGRAELVSLDDPAALELVEAGRLDSIAGRDAGARSATAAEVLAAA